MEDLRIRAYEPEDVPALTALFNQRRVAAGTLQFPMTSVHERLARYTQSPTLRMLVAETETQLVGEGSLRLFEGRRKHVGSIGIAVDESYQGLGIGAKLMAALLDLADNWYNLVRVELQVYDDNQAGIHLYEKFGFTVEGTHRAFAFRDGNYVNALTMARIRAGTMQGSGD
jgi:L-phenylalanine/L-methionine N-acetyltransferase